MREAEPKPFDQEAAARLCIEQWKLIRATERMLPHLHEREGQRLAALLRFADRQLPALATRMGFSLVAFDDQMMRPGLPASADNADEFGPDDELVVLATVEPAVVRDMRVIVSGRVRVGLVKKDGADASGD